MRLLLLLAAAVQLQAVVAFSIHTKELLMGKTGHQVLQRTGSVSTVDQPQTNINGAVPEPRCQRFALPREFRLNVGGYGGGFWTTKDNATLGSFQRATLGFNQETVRFLGGSEPLATITRNDSALLSDLTITNPNHWSEQAFNEIYPKKMYGSGDNITQHYVILNCQEDTIMYNMLQGNLSRGWVFDIYTANFSKLIATSQVGRTFSNQIQFFALNNDSTPTTITSFAQTGSKVGAKSGTGEITRELLAHAEKSTPTTFEMIFDPAAASRNNPNELTRDESRWILAAIATHRAVLEQSRSEDGSATPPSNYVAFVFVGLLIAAGVVWMWIFLLYMIFRTVYPLQEELEYMRQKQMAAANLANPRIDYANSQIMSYPPPQSQQIASFNQFAQSR